jgi:phenylacetate-CoA ligase
MTQASGIFSSAQLKFTSQDWMTSGKAHALELFHSAAIRVPAYQKFLKEHGVKPTSIQTIDDFSKIPVMDKENYIDRYPLEQLVWDGDLSRGVILNSSSGTMGKSYFWPCDVEETKESAEIYEHIFRNFFNLNDRKTLLMICFGMGTWIAGSYTFVASHIVSCKGADLTIVTPGLDKNNALRILEEVAPKFEQVILAGIPSIIKDLVDTWVQTRVNSPSIVRYFLAGEGFSESWRDYIQTNTKAAGVFSILGSADAGLMAFETFLTQSLRQQAQDRDICHQLFQKNRVPATFQFIPTHRYFETDRDELLITARRALPLIRYNLHDEGGILYPEDLDSQKNINLTTERNNYQVKLPIVYVFGRGKFATSLYGLTIYPEDVQTILVHPEISAQVTSRFNLSCQDNENFEPQLQIDIELADGNIPNPQLGAKIASLFVHVTRINRSEYNRIYEEFGDKATPKVLLHLYGAAPLFPLNLLHKIS